MAEYIEKCTVVNRLIDLENEFQQYKPFHGFEHAMYRKICEAEIAIGKTTSADVTPVRHGRWLHTEEPLGWKDVDCMECSACHDSWIIEEDYCFDDMPLWNYCPSCGAKMDGG